MILFLLVLSLCFAQEELQVKYFLSISGEIECPGDTLYVKTMGSDGFPAENVELRFVLYSPYQGLRSIKTTDQNGLAKTTITKPGVYRIYINTDEYNHDKFVSFNYSELCPPPPPEEFNLSVQPDCENNQTIINLTKDGDPLQDVFVRTDVWSSTTNTNGIAVFPLQEGILTVYAELIGYTSQNLTMLVDCTPPPPPECLEDDDCSFDEVCEMESCINISGECGYAEDHSWVSYECCEDDDCGFRMICANSSCIIRPEPPEPGVNETVEEEASEEPEACVPLLIPFVLIIVYYEAASKKTM